VTTTGRVREALAWRRGHTMPDAEEYPRCVRCGAPIRINKDMYDVFERMHYLCFHLEFEHGDYGPVVSISTKDYNVPYNRARSDDSQEA